VLEHDMTEGSVWSTRLSPAIKVSFARLDLVASFVALLCSLCANDRSRIDAVRLQILDS